MSAGPRGPAKSNTAPQKPSQPPIQRPPSQQAFAQPRANAPKQLPPMPQPQTPFNIMQSHLNNMLFQISLIFRDPAHMQERRESFHNHYTESTMRYQQAADNLEDQLVHAKQVLRGKYAVYLENKKRKLAEEEAARAKEVERQRAEQEKAEAEAKAQAEKAKKEAEREVTMTDAPASSDHAQSTPKATQPSIPASAAAANPAQTSTPLPSTSTPQNITGPQEIDFDALFSDFAGQEDGNAMDLSTDLGGGANLLSDVDLTVLPDTIATSTPTAAPATATNATNDSSLDLTFLGSPATAQPTTTSATTAAQDKPVPATTAADKDEIMDFGDGVFNALDGMDFSFANGAADDTSALDDWLNGM